VFRHLKFTILTAAFSKKGDIGNEILLWRSGVQDPTEIEDKSVEFKRSIKDTKVIKLFDGPSPLQFIKFGPSIVFTSPNKDYFDSMKKFMHSTNQYLKLWSEEEITEAVSVLRAKCAIDEEITDAVIKKRMLKCGPTPRQLFCPERKWIEYEGTINESIGIFNDMKSVIAVVSSKSSPSEQSVGEIAHSILCMDPIDTPPFSYISYQYVFASKFIEEEFIKYFRLQLLLTQQEFIRLIDGTSKCAVLRGHLFEDAVHQMLWTGGMLSRRLLTATEASTGEESVLHIFPAASKTKTETAELKYDLAYYVAPSKKNFPAIDGWCKTDGFQAFYRENKKHPVCALGIYSWIKSMGAVVLDEFKKNPSSVSINFVVPKGLASMARQQFDNPDMFENNARDVDMGLIPGIKLGKQLDNLIGNGKRTCRDVINMCMNDTDLQRSKRSKTIQDFMRIQSDEVTMDMINQIPQYVMEIPCYEQPINV